MNLIAVINLTVSDLGYRRGLSRAIRVFLLGCTLLTASIPGYSGIVNMRCEYLKNPLGIDALHPRFNWEYSTDKSTTDFKEANFQLLIAVNRKALEKSDLREIFWVSAKTSSSAGNIIYTGSRSLESHAGYYWKVIVKDHTGKLIEDSPIQYFETGKLNLHDWQALWISDKYDKDFEPSPMFCKQLKLKSSIVKARLYISAVAYYKLWVNGEEASQNVLDPGYTHYDKRNLYVTHDVTRFVKEGLNSLSVVLGNGFYNAAAPVATWDFEKARWRNRPRFIAELRVTYADGSSAVISTDSTWKTNTGPYVRNNIYSGDTYDARKEIKGWTLPVFNAEAWQNAIVVNAPSPVLVAQAMPPIQITQTLKPVSYRSFGDTIYVFDFGVNFSGVCSLSIAGEEGQVITLQHGELLNSDGRLEMRNLDIYYKPSPGLAFQSDVYILSRNVKHYPSPSFSYHGFRYAEVRSSKPIQLNESNLTAYFLHTNVKPVGSFSCSDTTLNKIWKATNQSYLSNLHSIPTDCPQREKNGWTADAHIAAELGLLNFDGITFYEKWINDIIDNQQRDGSISGIIPSSGWGYADWIGPVWDAVMFILPDALYNYYGDKQSIENIYPACEKYLDYLKRREDKDGCVTYGIGDWVPYNTKTPTEFTSSCFYYLDYKLMAKFAALTGRDASPFLKKAEALKKIINEKYFDAAKFVYANGSQTALALSLYIGLVPPEKEQQVADSLHESVKANNYFLDFGVLGSKTVLRMLTKYGYADVAYAMAAKKSGPSWGGWIEQGFSTLAETWILSPDFRDASVNHVFLGDVSAWMYNALAGINYDEQNPGFKNIVIQPHFVEGLEWVKGEYHSVNGVIRSEWKRSNGKVFLTVAIPANTTAIIIHKNKRTPVKSGVHQFTF